MFRSMMYAVHVIDDAFDVCYRYYYMLCTLLPILMHAHRYLIYRSIIMLNIPWYNDA
jgi:hypothetical protein